MNINRYVYSQLVNDLRRPEVSIILGPRQVAKTFLHKELESLVLARVLRTRYYNLELPTIFWLSESWNHYVKAN